jgi:hypothetical protein
MTARSSLPTETIECPLCSGAGELKRTEVLNRLGVKDFARVAQLSAEEAFRLLQNKHNHEHQSVWARFETELGKRTAEIRDQHKDELRAAQSETPASVNGRKWTSPTRLELGQVLSSARSFPATATSLLAFCDPSGSPTEPRIVVDNKDKATVTEGDIKKLIRDARERRIPVGIIVAREDSQLRQLDRERRWDQEDGVWIADNPLLVAARSRGAQAGFRAHENRRAAIPAEEFRSGGGSPPNVR